MTIDYYRLKSGQEPQVVDLIHQLMQDYGASFTSVITAEQLRDNADFVHIEVADEGGEVIGICAWTMTYSTWRGLKGMYIVDHHVKSGAWSGNVPKKLLQYAAKSGAAQGAHFIRTEIDVSEESIESLYSRLGFWRQNRHSMYFLESDKFAALLKD